MRKLTRKYRIRVPNRIAGLAALLLLVSCVIAPMSMQGNSISDKTTVATDDPASLISASDNAAASTAKHKKFKISSLIFRF